MRTLELWLIGYLLNSLWQIPLVFAAALVAAWLARPAGVRIEHRVWVGAFLIEILLPLCNFDLNKLWQQVRALATAVLAWTLGGGLAGGEVRVSVLPGVAYSTGFLHIPGPLLVAILVAYACSLLYYSGRLTWALWRTYALQRQAQPLPLIGNLATKFARYSCFLGVRTAQTAISPAISSPMTIGVTHPILLFPPTFLDSVSDIDLDAVLAHELAHMQRHDFAKNLFYSLLALPMSFHPVLWLTRSRLAETREMVCDTIAAAAISGRESYARSLLRLASLLSTRTPDRNLHAIGIFDANSFERRVMNLTQKRTEIPLTRRLAIAVTCGGVVLATCASALALRIHVAAPSVQSDSQKTPHVDVKDLTIIYKKQPIYPAQAKLDKNTLDGEVLLEVTIGKAGVVEHIIVKKSLRYDYDRSALDAVKDWRWQPYVLNGEPVEVDTTVAVTYSIEK